MKFTNTYYGYIIKNNKIKDIKAVYKKNETFYYLNTKRKINVIPKKEGSKYLDTNTLIPVSDYIHVYDRYLDYSYMKVRKNTKKIRKRMF